MARIHARKKGKSGSKRPVKKDLSMVSLSKKEVEKLILKLYEEGYSKSYIGIILRDNYAVPDVKAFLGKKISKVLEENKVKEVLPEDLKFLTEKAKNLKKHLERNPKDIHNRRAYNLLISKIRRLSKYYKSIGKIEEGWSFN